jgi:dsDNA-specific endonuclease/ATPase MutS2
MAKTYDDKMGLDMPFDEALERFAGTDPEEVRANIAKSKAAKPEAERKRSTPKPDQTNVTKLRGQAKGPRKV